MRVGVVRGDGRHLKRRRRHNALPPTVRSVALEPQEWLLQALVDAREGGNPCRLALDFVRDQGLPFPKGSVETKVKVNQEEKKKKKKKKKKKRENSNKQRTFPSAL